MPNTDRILLVEDDRDVQSALFFLLRHRGHSVLTADNGQQALDFLDHGITPKLLILDLGLPKVPGWEILRHLQSDPTLRHVRVIVITGLNYVPVGADAVFYKPVDDDALLDAIDRLTQSPPH
jgi:CheY-like chemotaxis protein